MYILQLIRMQNSSNRKSDGLLKMKTRGCNVSDNLVNGLWFGRVMNFQPHYGLGFK
jgi:hypothetical protein